MVYGEPTAVTLARWRSWRRWFAWYPVELSDGRGVWLQWIERRRLATSYNDSGGHYRLIEEPNKPTHTKSGRPIPSSGRSGTP